MLQWTSNSWNASPDWSSLVYWTCAAGHGSAWVGASAQTSSAQLNPAAEGRGAQASQKRVKGHSGGGQRPRGRATGHTCKTHTEAVKAFRMTFCDNVRLCLALSVGCSGIGSCSSESHRRADAVELRPRSLAARWHPAAQTAASSFGHREALQSCSWILMAQVTPTYIKMLQRNKILTAKAKMGVK